MAIPARIVDEQVWGTFSDVRHAMHDQFQDVPYDARTGLPAEALSARIEAYLRAHADQPRVLLKAHAFRIVATEGQICVDPHDWFADKLDHGHILRRLRDRWYDEARSGALEVEAGWFDQVYDMGIARGLLDTGHISPGW